MLLLCKLALTFSKIAFKIKSLVAVSNTIGASILSNYDIIYDRIFLASFISLLF